MNIEEIEVNVKTYKTYSHLKDIQFIGQRDFSFLDTIWVGDLLENPFKGLDEYTYEFITDAYNYHPIYEQRENEGYYVKNWQGQGITANQKTYDKTHETNHDHHIRTDLTDEEKNRVYSIIIGMIDKFKGDEKNKQSIKYKLNHSTIIRPSKDGIKEIQKGRYLDIFRRTPEDTVLLRAEYYFDGTNWCEVNIKDLKCNRKIDYSSASKTINVPANQIIYLMLSDIEQSPQRLEALRVKLEKQTPKDWAVVNDFMNNPTKIFTPIVETKQEPYFTVSKGAIYDNRLRALEYPKINIDLKNKLEKNPCMVGYENIIYEDNDTPTLIVPDFAEYAENLFESLAKSYHFYIAKTGADLSLNEDYINQPIENKDDKTEEEKNIIKQDEHNTKLLKYLSELICDKNNKWDLLNRDKGYDLFLKRDLFNIRREFRKINYLAKKLSWWICQSPYQDLLYDYEFYCEYTEKDSKLFDEYIDKRFLQYLFVLENISVANDALLYLYKDFQTKSYSIFKDKNNDLKSEFYSNYEQYIIGESSKIKDDFTLLQSYKSLQESNWLVEIAYPKVKKIAKEGYLKVLGILSHIVVIRDGKRYQADKILKLFKKFLHNCSDKDVIIRIDKFDNEGAGINLTNKRNKSIYILYLEKEGKGNNESSSIKGNIVEFIKSSSYTKAIKYAVSAIDKAIMIYNLAYTEDGNDYIKVIDSITEELIQLSKYNDSIKNTVLGKIKLRNGKIVFKEWTGIVSIAASIATMIYYIYEGDTKYAVIDFSCDMILFGVTLVFGGFYLTVAMIFIRMAIEVWINNLKTDSFEKWVSLNNYGCDHELLSGEKRYPYKWTHTIYPKFVEDRTHFDINKVTKNWFENTKEQLRTYYRILTPIKVSTVLYQRYANELVSDKYTKELYGIKKSYEQYYTLCVELTMNEFYPSDKFALYLKNGNTTYQIPKNPNKDEYITKDYINHVINKDGINKLLLIFQGNNKKHNERIMEEIESRYRIFNLNKKMKTISASDIINSISHNKNKIELSIEYYSSFYNSINNSNEPITTVISDSFLTIEISKSGV